MKFEMVHSYLMGLVLIFLLVGCASRPRVDWNSRIGQYTFDQSVLEIGPPDKWVKLTDGTVVGEWLTHIGFHRGAIYGVTGMYPQFYQDIPTPDYYLRLTFAPDGHLAAWKRFAK